MPKSSSLGSPSAVTRMLPGLRSRWHDQPLVRRVHCRADLAHETEAILDGEVAFQAIAIDRYPLHVLHDQERPPVGSGAAVEQTCDVRVIELGEDLPLAVEPPD